MEQLGPDAMLVLWSAPPRLFSNDTYYEYRQDSDLYYLTGVAQEGTTLVLMPGNQTQKAILFISDFDPVREHWQGHSLTVEEARELSGFKPSIARRSSRASSTPRSHAARTV